MTRRMKIQLAVLAVLLALATAWSLGRLLTEQAAACAAARDLADCRKFEADIVRLRVQPTLASERERQSTELAGPIEKAAKEAGIPADRLLRISPEPAQRVAETAYKEKPTRVFLKNVTLQQVVAMVHGLTRNEEGLNLKSIRLTALSREATTNLWSAELILAYLIYEPQKSSL